MNPYAPPLSVCGTEHDRATRSRHQVLFMCVVGAIVCFCMAALMALTSLTDWIDVVGAVEMAIFGSLFTYAAHQNRDRPERQAV